MVDYEIQEYWTPPYPTTCSSDDMFVQLNVGNCSSVTGTHRVKTQENVISCGFQNLTPYGQPKKYTWTGEITSTNSNIVQWYLRTSLQPTAVLKSQQQSLSSGDTVKWKITVITPDYTGPSKNPRYLEQLHKLNQSHTRVVYDPQ